MHEAERALVADRARDLGVEPLDERAPVEQARQRVVVGEEAQLALVRRGDDRGGGLVREDAQRLQLLARRQQPVFGLVGPDEADHGACAVVQRDEQPVAVPRARPAAVQLRDVRPAVVRERALAPRRSGAGSSPPSRTPDRAAARRRRATNAEVGAAPSSPSRPAARALEPRRSPGRSAAASDVLEAERVADAAADGAQDLVGDAARPSRRDETRAAARARAGDGPPRPPPARPAPRARVVGDRDEHVELLVGRALAAVPARRRRGCRAGGRRSGASAGRARPRAARRPRVARLGRAGT